MEKIAEDGKLAMFMVGRINILKGHSPKSNWQIQCSPHQNFNTFFSQKMKCTLNFIWKYKWPRIVKTIQTNNKFAGFYCNIFHVVPQSYRNLGRGHWQNSRLIVQWSWVEDPKVNSHSYSHPISHKEINNTHGRKYFIFVKNCCSNWTAADKRMKVNPFLFPCAKLISPWINGLK